MLANPPDQARIRNAPISMAAMMRITRFALFWALAGFPPLAAQSPKKTAKTTSTTRIAETSTIITWLGPRLSWEVGRRRWPGPRHLPVGPRVGRGVLRKVRVVEEVQRLLIPGDTCQRWTHEV